MKEKFTIEMNIRVEAEYDPEKTDEATAKETAANKVIEDARAHRHTIESGIRIIDIKDLQNE